MAIAPLVTLSYVATKSRRVSQGALDHFARTLTDWVNKQFDGNQTRAAKVLGVTQGHISAMMRGDRGPGLNTLILLRAQVGTSIDELLGLGPPPIETHVERMKASLDLEVARFRAEARRRLDEADAKLARLGRSPEPAGTAEKAPTPTPKKKMKG